jgi:uncharacterized protein
MVINEFLLLTLIPLFFAISFIYSSVGFAGGSSYIAILVLVGVNLFTIPPVSLALNIVVASIALFNYLKAGHLSLRISAPLLISVPFAFIGGFTVLPEKLLILIFVIALFLASAMLLLSGNQIKTRQEKIQKLNLSLSRLSLITLPIGAVLGTVSGAVGIGGGIWLSPILILTGLTNPKNAAASASLFILTNSVSGLVAHSITKQVDFALILPLALVVLLGGFLGSRLGAFKLSHEKLIFIIGMIVAIAGINLATRMFR